MLLNATINSGKNKKKILKDLHQSSNTGNFNTGHII